MRKLLMFDCFGTVFDMSTLPRGSVGKYAAHVKSKGPWEPLKLPQPWWDLKAHPDAAEGIKQLMLKGYTCVTCSNGPADLLTHLSRASDVHWDAIIGLEEIQVYKPNPRAYEHVRVKMGFEAKDTTMVTANPLFGDVESATALNMQVQLVRVELSPPDLLALAKLCPNIRGH